jgi:hypothetical protein
VVLPWLCLAGSQSVGKLMTALGKVGLKASARPSREECWRWKLYAREAHERMPQSRLEVFAGAGHFPYHDAPERFAELLDDFVRTTTPLPMDRGRLRSRLRSGPRRA